MAKKAKYYQRPDGLYETSRTINGKRVKFRGRSCAEVDRKLLEYDITKKKGRKFPAVADEWYEKIEKNIRQSTKNSYGKEVERLKEEFPGHIGEIEPIDLDNYLSRKIAYGYAKSTLDTVLTVTKQIFSYAVVQGDIRISPAVELKLPRKLPKKKRNALTEAQEAKVDACRTGRWWLMGLILLYAGPRKGELVALDWKDFDDAAGVIHFNKKLNWAYGNTPVLEVFLKSENGLRDTPILKNLADAVPKDHPKSGLMFPGPDGGYMTASYYTKIWKEYCADAGLLVMGYNSKGNPAAVPAVTAHCFRHSFATICFEAELDEKTAAAYLGDTEEIARAVYTELRERRKVSGAEKVNAYLEARKSDLVKAVK